MRSTLQPSESAARYTQPKPAHPATEQHQREVAAQLNFADNDDFTDANRGFIGSVEEAAVRGEAGNEVWSVAKYGFLKRKSAPATVNPSLWRLARLNYVHGLFKVTERIYQVRGFDLANVTFIESDNGLIVIDPLTFEESAKAALALYEKHRGRRPIVAVIYSHSHRDHYGGVGGVITEEDATSGRVQVIAPDGFMEEAVSEAILAGVPMRRRAQFQLGTSLEPGERSHVDAGLGKASGKGTSGLIAPTVIITKTGERMVIDGVETEFHLTPGAEAPAEMNFFFPGLRALNMAENACHTMHNLCPIRGAKTRDALAWARYIDEAIDEYAPHVDVLFAQHHWPVWGQERLTTFLSEQRDLYRYLHDQTLRLMSHGMTPREIAEELLIPVGLATKWHTRGYYGAVVHNVQAIYAHYMGPYDGNPANLNPLAPTNAGKKYIEYMGGMDAVLTRAKTDFDRGEFRWVLQVMNHAVFTDPTNTAARELAADAMEQLGYQAESATWRNAYLLGVRELREGRSKRPIAGDVISADVVAKLPIGQFLDFLAIRVNGLAISAMTARFDWVMTDEGTTHRITIGNGSLNHRQGSHGDAAMATIHANRSGIAKSVRSDNGLLDVIAEGAIRVEGDTGLVTSFLQALDRFDPMFAIVEP